MKDITINIDFDKSPFNSKSDNSLREYSEQVRKENNKPEYLEENYSKVLHQVPGYEIY